MRLDLAAMTARVGQTKRKSVDIPVIQPTQATATDLAAIHVKMLRALSERVKAHVMPAYERALVQASVRDHIADAGTMIRDDIPELQGELASLDAEMQRLVLTLVPELRNWTIRTEAVHRRKWIAGTLTATGVDLTTLIGAEDVRETLGAVLARNTALMKDLSAQAQGRVADAVWRGFQARTPARKVAKEITEGLQISRARALRIASDQALKLSVTLDQERQTQAGITEFIWRHSRKAHPRQEHVERDGKVFKWSKLPADGAPGTLPNCGCKAQARLVI